MASLTIKGVPDSLLNVLRKRAEQHRRSLNSEVLQLLENSAGASQINPDAVLTRIHRLQERTALPPLTDSFLEQALEEERP
ncbi:MAG TPA: Arc family DNA-binding protein [Longimicrobiaceae bacterium]|nr:Arc family DNA-binding protein [Longimicrobiaceae bacterium]